MMGIGLGQAFCSIPSWATLSPTPTPLFLLLRSEEVFAQVAQLILTGPSACHHHHQLHLGFDAMIDTAPLRDVAAVRAPYLDGGVIQILLTLIMGGF